MALPKSHRPRCQPCLAGAPAGGCPHPWVHRHKLNSARRRPADGFILPAVAACHACRVASRTVPYIAFASLLMFTPVSEACSMLNAQLSTQTAHSDSADQGGMQQQQQGGSATPTQQ